MAPANNPAKSIACAACLALVIGAPAALAQTFGAPRDESFEPLRERPAPRSGDYDRQSDRWRPAEPDGNAFERALRDDPYRTETDRDRQRTIGRRYDNEDGLTVRDLSDLPGASTSGSGLSGKAWRGVDARRFAAAIAAAKLPPRSLALAELWRTLALTPATRTRSMSVLQAELLYRTGQLEALLGTDHFDDAPPEERALIAVTQSKAHRALGQFDRACARADQAARALERLPQIAQRDALTSLMLCALEDGNDRRARDLARDLEQRRLPAAIPIAITRYLVDKAAPDAPIPERMTLLDFEFLRRARSAVTQKIVETAEPALIRSIVKLRQVPPRERLRALDRAAPWAALQPEERRTTLQTVSRTATSGPAADLSRVYDANVDAAGKLQALARMMAGEKPFATCRAIATAISREINAIEPGLVNAPERDGMLEALIAAGNYEQAQRWLAASDDGRSTETGRHWQTLIAIANPASTRLTRDRFAATTALATRGRLSPQLLHRLVTVMDALRFDIPVPLWEAASRTKQPAGYLPPTGTLSRLKASVRAGRKAETVLLAVSALGPEGPAQTSIIALGDVIRALTASGLEKQARLVALEAIWPVWSSGSGQRLTRR